MTFTAYLPLPSPTLSPNAKPHWAYKARAIKAARKEAWYWFNRVKPSDWKPIPIQIEVHYHCPKKTYGYKPRDSMNAIAAMKPMIDGMVDAGIIPDDSANWLSWGKFKLTRRANGIKAGVYIKVSGS